MHIAFLTPEYPHSKVKHSGGPGTSIKNLVVALVEKGIRVTVFIYGQPEAAVFEENGVVFHLIANKKYRFAKWFFYRKYIQNYVNSVVKKDRIDLVEAPDWTGVTAFMRFDFPQFNNEHPECFEKGLVLYIGTIIRKKGVFELPEIFNKVRNQFPEAKLVLIGGDSGDIATGNKSTWELVKQQFHEKDLEQVSYLGKIPYNEVQDYIKKANVCVFPTYAETLGMVTIESMAMQKPVVNSNIGWAQELMEDKKSGFLVHPSHHEEYANRIVSILQNNYLYLDVGKEAVTFVHKTFDIDEVVLQNIAFYRHKII